MGIHPLAVVHPSARIGEDCEIGPFAVVEAGVVLGRRCVLASHVVVKQATVLGDDNCVAEHSVLGGLPQHVQARTDVGGLRVGSGNTFREYVTIHRALHRHADTIVGDANFIMVNAHVAHDCTLGSNIIIANNAMLSGHVTVCDRAFLSGSVAIHQFCRIGRMAMLGGCSRIGKDVPPYVTIDGGTGFVVGLNTIGLRRSGLSNAEIQELKQAYRVIYRSGLPWNAVMERLAEQFPSGRAAEFHRFFSEAKRGIVPERRLPPGATIKLAEPKEGDADCEPQTKVG